jgi:hypothetical protein
MIMSAFRRFSKTSAMLLRACMDFLPTTASKTFAASYGKELNECLKVGEDQQAFTMWLKMLSDTSGRTFNRWRNMVLLMRGSEWVRIDCPPSRPISLHVGCTFWALQERAHFVQVRCCLRMALDIRVLVTRGREFAGKCMLGSADEVARLQSGVGAWFYSGSHCILRTAATRFGSCCADSAWTTL